MVVFEFTLDEAFLVEMFARYRSSSAFGRARPWTRIATAALIVGAIVLNIVVTDTWSLVGLAPFALLFLLLGRVENWSLVRRFKQSPHRNERTHVEVNDDGFSVRTSSADSRLTWAAFTRCLRFEDGILLFQGPHVFHWLPFRCLVKGSAADVEQVVRSHVADYSTV